MKQAEAGLQELSVRVRALHPSPFASAGGARMRSPVVWKRKGARGRIHDSPGCGTNTARAFR